MDHPCPRCTKACGNQMLGKALCVRQSLLNVRFRLGNYLPLLRLYADYLHRTDLWHRNSDLDWLGKEVTQLSGIPQTITVFLSPCYSFKTSKDIEFSKYMEARPKYNYTIPSFKRAVPLEITVRQFTPLQGSEARHIMYVYDSDTPESTPAPMACYAIPPEFLPSLESIETWALDTMTSYPMHASLGWLRSSFFNFAYTYCESPKDIPLVSF
jgi:hypothetical protein